jgi:hypothetical protein
VAGLDIEITAGPIRPIAASVAFADTPLIEGPCALYGWSFRETTGVNPAQYKLMSGSQILAEFVIGAGLSDTKWLGAMGVYAGGGITVHPVGGETGSIEGVVYAGYYS